MVFSRMWKSRITSRNCHLLWHFFAFLQINKTWRNFLFFFIKLTAQVVVYSGLALSAIFLFNHPSIKTLVYKSIWYSCFTWRMINILFLQLETFVDFTSNMPRTSLDTFPEVIASSLFKKKRRRKMSSPANAKCCVAC